MANKTKAQKAAGRKAAAKKGAATRAANQAAAAEGNDSEQPVAEDAPSRETLLRDGLISMNEHNDIRIAFWREPDSKLPVPNGIGCPNCGEELVDKTPGLIQFGNPPRIEVRCDTDRCDYRALRVA